MKPYTSILAILLACGSAHATTATTTPVGYVTTTIAGAGSNPSADSYVSCSLVQPTVFAGQSASAASHTVTFSGTSVPTTLDSTYVLEITSGTHAGWWSTVTSSTSSTIVVNDVVPDTSPVTITVRLHNTVASYLGANAPGLITFDGVSANDSVQILDPSTQASVAIAYVPASVSGAAQDGWFDLASSSPADNYIIEPGAAVKINRVGSGSLSFTSSGTVKTTPTQVDIYPTYNWIGTQLATGGTLNGMGFNTQLVLFDGVNPNYDELDFLAPDQSGTPYAALDPSLGLGATMGNLGDSSDAGAVVFPQSFGAVLNRIGTTSTTVITIPGTVVAP